MLAKIANTMPLAIDVDSVSVGLNGVNWRILCVSGWYAVH